MDKDFLNSLRKIKLFDVTVIIFISALGWALYFFQTFLFAKCLNIDLSYFQISMCISISSLFAMIPITISGIGTRDATLILLFGALGLSKEKAVMFSLLILLIFILNAVISLPFWIMMKNNRDEIKA